MSFRGANTLVKPYALNRLHSTPALTVLLDRRHRIKRVQNNVGSRNRLQQLTHAILISLYGREHRAAASTQVTEVRQVRDDYGIWIRMALDPSNFHVPGTREITVIKKVRADGSTTGYVARPMRATDKKLSNQGYLLQQYKRLLEWQARFVQTSRSLDAQAEPIALHKDHRKRP